MCGILRSMETKTLGEWRRLALGAACMVAAASCLAAGDRPWMKGVTDRPAVDYKPGDPITFTLTLERAETLPPGLVIDWTRTGDDGRRETGKAPADPAKPLAITTSLDRPGFVRIFAVVRNPDGTIWAPKGVTVKKDRAGELPGSVFFDGGAGVSVDAIRQSVPEPKDFDDFWARHKAALAAVPMDGAKCEELPSANPSVRLYIVTVPCAGPRPATGYLIVPAKPGKYPAEVSFHGYASSWSGRATKAPDLSRAKGDTLKLILSAHGFELNRDAAYYKEFAASVKSNGHGHAFDPVQNSDPEKAYFCGMTYRVMRGIEYLKSRPEWDGRRLAVTGASQGGLQSIWGAALVPGVSEMSISVPWCCDMASTSVGRNHGEWFVEWVPALGYYDPVNMAKRIPSTCRVRVTRAGLGDYTCPPSGVAAFYNNLSRPKSIVWMQGSTHGYVPPQRETFAKSDVPVAWVTDEEREAVKRRVTHMDFIAGTPETDAKRFYMDEARTQFVEFNYDESKSGEGTYTLEDPLAFADGRKLKDASEWPARRREILALFEREVYGRMPPKPDEIVTELMSEKLTADRFALERRYRMWFRKDRSGPVIDWIVFVPRHAKQPCPVILHLNYGGNDTIAAGRTNHYLLPLGDIAAHGYAFMSARYTQITSDGMRRGGDVYDGVCELWGRRAPKHTDNPGSLIIWAWGLSRGLDLAERIAEIDAKRSVVTGSSRLGKAALLAAAYDERFAVCVPNQTGAVGVQLMKRNYGETLAGQRLSLAHWYCQAVWKYKDDPKSQPFDQHLLLACVAPRALLLECYHKRWFDPLGEFLSAKAASPVWEFLGVGGLGLSEMPPPYDESHVRPPFGYVRRTECHGLSPYDWKWTLDFADRAFAK